MVDTSQAAKQDQSVLRWGGLASIGGGLLFIVVFAVVIVFAGPEPAGPDGAIRRFPDIRAVRTVENGLYLTVLVLWAPLFLALYRRLRSTSPAAALFGSGLGILGLGVLAAGALPHVVAVRLSGLYHAPGATPEDRATLVLLWQATDGLFDALLLAGLLVMPIGVVVLGLAMHAHPTFGRGFARLSVGLGVAGLVAAGISLIDPLSLVAALGIFALITFHLVVGWRAYSMSRAD